MKENKKLKLKKIFDENLDTIDGSTAHAFHNIVSNRHIPVKIMWSLCLLGSAGYCGKVMYDYVTQYLEYPVVSQININQLNQIQFPIVKICKLDGMTRNYKKLPSYELIKVALLRLMIMDCRYGGKECDYENDFQYYIDPQLGDCFRFNSGFNMNDSEVPLRVSKSPGRSYGFVNPQGDGLSLKLYVISQNYDAYSLEIGFNILVSYESESSLNRQGINVAPGFSFDIVINRQTTTFQPTPYSECIDGLTTLDAYDSIYYKKTINDSLNNKRSYHYSDCLFFCYKKYIGDTCNVQLYPPFNGPPFYDNMEIVSADYNNNETIFDCASFMKSWPKFIQSSYVDNCDCPVECSRTEFTAKSSFTKFPTTPTIRDYFLKNPYFQYNFQNLDPSLYIYDYLKDNVLEVNVYYDELKETLITYDIKMTIVDLLGLIGGVLGLFLGMSFLTLIEVFEIIFQTFLIACEDSCSSKKANKSSNVIFVQNADEEPNDEKI